MEEVYEVPVNYIPKREPPPPPSFKYKKYLLLFLGILVGINTVLVLTALGLATRPTDTQQLQLMEKELNSLKLKLENQKSDLEKQRQELKVASDELNQTVTLQRRQLSDELEVSKQSLWTQMMDMKKGTVYTRWGRTRCGNNSSIVYTGK